MKHIYDFDDEHNDLSEPYDVPLLIIVFLAITVMIVAFVNAHSTRKLISECDSIDKLVPTSVSYDSKSEKCYGYIKGSMHYFRLDGDTVIIKEHVVSIKYE